MKLWKSWVIAKKDFSVFMKKKKDTLHPDNSSTHFLNRFTLNNSK